jgi:large subunit ribosomal protein L15
LSNEFSVEDLVSVGLVGKNDLVKVLGRGEVSSSLTITAHKFTASAKAAIEAAGGKAITD